MPTDVTKKLRDYYNDYKYDYNPNQAPETMDNYQFNRWAEQNPTKAADLGAAGFKVNSNNMSGNMYDSINPNKSPGSGTGFSMEGLAGLASDASSIVGLVSGLDNLFGSGKDMRKATLANLEQQMDQSAGLYDMLKKDKAEFAANREKITNSYKNGG